MKRHKILGAVLGLLAAVGLHAEPATVHGLNVERLADAIYRAEGAGLARVPYGILSVKVRSKEEARRVCIRTIRHAARDFPGGVPLEFISYLGNRYCPASVDLKGNVRWKRNVAAIYFGKQNINTK